MVSGSVYHHSATWLISGNLQSELLSKSGALTIVDGILGTLIHGGTKGLLKGVLLLGSALATLAVLYASIKLRYEYFHYGLAISLAILILVVVLNQHGIWAAMRFDRLLAIPIAWIANTSSGLNQIKWWRPPAILILLSGLFLSQFTYAWYMARIYFG